MTGKRLFLLTGNKRETFTVSVYLTRLALSIYFSSLDQFAGLPLRKDCVLFPLFRGGHLTTVCRKGALTHVFPAPGTELQLTQPKADATMHGLGISRRTCCGNSRAPAGGTPTNKRYNSNRKHANSRTPCGGCDRWWMSVRITLIRLQLTHPASGCDQFHQSYSRRLAGYNSRTPRRVRQYRNGA